MREARSIVALFVAVILVLAGCANGEEPEQPDPTPATPPGTEPPTSGWSTLAPMPQERTEHSVVALDGRVYVAGGFAEGGQLPTEFFSYDPETDSWSEGAPIPEGRHHAPLAAYDGRVYLVGGYAGASGETWLPTATLFVYDVAAGSWSEGPAMPAPRGAHAVAVTDEGRIHVVGGVEGSARAEHFVFDPATQEWSTLPDLPTPREHLGAAYHDGVVYVAVGRASGVSDLRDFEAYDVAGQEWTILPEVPTGRSGVAVAAYDGWVYVFGGETFGTGSRTFDEAERYDPATGAWQELPPMPTARHGFGAGVLADGIAVIGGGPEPGLTYSGVTELWRP